MSTRNRTLAIVLTCVTCASAAAAQSPEQERARQLRDRSQFQRQPVERRAQRRGGEATAEARETFSRTVPLVPGATFELRNMTGGDVTITGGGGRDVRIDAVKRVRNAGPRAQIVLDAIRIDVAERGGNVEVLTLQPRVIAGRAIPANRLVAVVDYAVILPPNVNVVLRSGAGNLRLQNVSGDTFEVNTLSGDVVMQELRGRRLDLHTVSGNMSLQNIDAERALLQSMAGNLEYIGRLLRTGRYKLQTHGGNIRVVPSGTPGFDLDATTHRGDLRSDFELTLLQVPPDGARPVRRVLKGKYGNAGAALTAQTFSGNIVIIKP